MLRIEVPETELYDEKRQEFIAVKRQTLQLEHSLVSVSKWESKWHKPFLDKTEKTYEETIDYIRCMTLTQNVDPNVYLALTPENLFQIQLYIDNPMTASTVRETPSRPGTGERVTSELIYYWMISLNIPMECQKWHLNRLFMLIRICNIKNAPPKKSSKRDIMRRNAALNAARKRKYGTRG